MEDRQSNVKPSWEEHGCLSWFLPLYFGLVLVLGVGLALWKLL